MFYKKLSNKNTNHSSDFKTHKERIMINELFWKYLIYRYRKVNTFRINGGFMLL